MNQLEWLVLLAVTASRFALRDETPDTEDTE
jgi:hypothetical protein